MKKNAFDPVRVRIWALTGLMGLCLVAFAGVMYYTQILHGEENRAKSLASCCKKPLSSKGSTAATAWQVSSSTRRRQASSP